MNLIKIFKLNLATAVTVAGSEDIMKKTIFNIDDLCGYAWECAIKNVYKILDENIGLEPLDLREDIGYEEIAKGLNIKFDVNGNII